MCGRSLFRVRSVAHSLQLQFDAVEKRWRRLVGLQPRERRCSFRCSTDWNGEASAAFFI
jgi:hypothetical protein